MIAYERARAARRRRNLIVLGLVAIGAIVIGPRAVAAAGAAWSREVVAEARGDTAQHIAIEVGQAIRLHPEVTGVAVERIAGGERCVVAPVDVPIDCQALVIYRAVDGGYLVVAERRGERFEFDSRDVDL